MEQFSCVVNTRPKCFAFFPPFIFVALHLLGAFQPEMCLRTLEGSVRFSCNLYFRFFQCIFLIYVYKLKFGYLSTVLDSVGISQSGISVVLH